MKLPTRLPIANAQRFQRRRGFLKAFATAGAAAAVAIKTKPARANCLDHRVAIAELASVGEGAFVDFEYPTASDVAFLTRLPRAARGGVGPGQRVVAFLRACPHMGCVIRDLKIEDAVLGPCGCHRSRFDLARGGRQIVGRASQDLVQVLLEIDDGVVYATGLAGLPYGHAMEG